MSSFVLSSSERLGNAIRKLAFASCASRNGGPIQFEFVFKF